MNLSETLEIARIDVPNGIAYFCVVDSEILTLFNHFEIDLISELYISGDDLINLLEIENNPIKDFKKLEQIYNYVRSNYSEKKIQIINVKFLNGNSATYNSGELSICIKKQIEYEMLTKKILSLYSFKEEIIFNALLDANGMYCFLEEPDEVYLRNDEVFDL